MLKFNNAEEREIWIKCTIAVMSALNVEPTRHYEDLTIAIKAASQTDAFLKELRVRSS